MSDRAIAHTLDCRGLVCPMRVIKLSKAIKTIEQGAIIEMLATDPGSRFCLVRAFREPFMTGEADHTRAAALAVIVSMVGFSILKLADLKDKSEWVFPGFWLGALAGGVLFGVGMILAGGCGAGSIWRAGEGHVKLWCAVAMFAVGASLGRMVLAQSGLLQKLGTAVFMPALVGWGGAMAIVVAVMATWYLVATWNEQSQKWSVM